MKIDKKPGEVRNSAVLGARVLNRMSAPQRNAAPKSPAVRIVLLEDSEPDVDLIRQTLSASRLNFSVVTVDSREEFEAELTRGSPNIILSDYWLPTFDGSIALEIAKQLAPRVPFIFVTGVLGEEVVIEMLKKGATDYVLKTRLTRLVPAINRALQERVTMHEHDMAQERLRRSHDQLRALTGHLQFVREEERTRIAREVHDELGQALTGLKLDLSWLSGRIPGDRTLQRRARAMSALIDATIHAVRRIATELRPGVLDSLGLAAAIEWQAIDFQERTGTRCETTIEVKDEILDREFSTTFFRIFQETLTNIIRHARATHVEVRLSKVDHELVLTVHDNGRGIPKEKIAHARSIGIIGMRERAAEVGGKVTFLAPFGRGTTVTMRAPMPAAVPLGSSPS